MPDSSNAAAARIDHDRPISITADISGRSGAVVRAGQGPGGFRRGAGGGHLMAHQFPQLRRRTAGRKVVHRDREGLQRLSGNAHSSLPHVLGKVMDEVQPVNCNSAPD